MQTDVKYIWHFQDHPLKMRRKEEKNYLICYSYQEVTKAFLKTESQECLVRSTMY